MAEADPMTTPREALLDYTALPTFTPDAAVLEEHKIVSLDSRDIRSRPFNLMRTKFTKQLYAHNLRMVGITSPAPTAGKSCLSLNLAGAIARLNDTPVLLVDLDLRRGSIAQDLGLEVQRGIGDFLEGKVGSIRDIAIRTEEFPLAILPTMPVSGDSSSLLASENYAELMRQLRAEAEKSIVLVDLPPVFANDDTMLTMEQLDAYLMVVHSGKTTERQLRDSMEMLRPAPCIGTVLNRYKGGLADSYGYTSSKTYSRYYD
ncbi:chromosome partitioning protein [Altererythrobacter aurantiacus]|uniref:Chromosome partitioning protein n=1 Tax=Parapontixanthobacter aurantiacus TaxID=1463599 RepID=A0A844ZIR7_9SPHN|nr:CpsD/CapB family tyrosine-protein kinase [Parapontixanthobacter aurantiacus]MXO87036.1 chromosome partitioning protein [Parapontixanthobacter aurantiacus]